MRQFENVHDLLTRHGLERADLMRVNMWDYEQARRKVKNLRGWTYEEVEMAASWFRLNGVPVTASDIRDLVVMVR